MHAHLSLHTENLPVNFPPYILSPPVPANQLKVVPYKSGHKYRSQIENLHSRKQVYPLKMPE